MRIGSNPLKQAPQLQGYLRHRVIIPVYIPELKGYFEHSLEVLKLCLESLRITSEGKASVTVISNDSALEVVEQLHRYYQDGWIDQLLLNQQNRGKIDAIVPVARGSFEEVITFSDCDVLFKPGWLEALEKIFSTFPECGAITPTPQLFNNLNNTSATVIGGLLNNELGFEKVVSDEDINNIVLGIGHHYIVKPEYKNAQMVIKRNDVATCVGGGHFVVAIRRRVLEGMPRYAALQAVSGNSESKWLDEPPDKLGFWHLSTIKAFVHHMGNTTEPWFYEEIESYQMQKKLATHLISNELPKPRPSKIPWKLRKLAMRLIQVLNLEQFLRNNSRKVH